jgi:hypothetical protein
MKVGLYLYNPATKQSVEVGEIEDESPAKDFLLKDVIGKGIRSAAEILGIDPMQVMTNPDFNKFSLRLKLIPEIHEQCGKPWGECTCGKPADRKLPQ